jgi:hypothetical protein
MHTIREWQMMDDGVARTAAAQFYSLMAQGILAISKFVRLVSLMATQAEKVPESRHSMQNALEHRLGLD